MQTDPQGLVGRVQGLDWFRYVQRIVEHAVYIQSYALHPNPEQDGFAYDSARCPANADSKALDAYMNRMYDDGKRLGKAWVRFTDAELDYIEHEGRIYAEKLENAPQRSFLDKNKEMYI